MAVSLFLVSSSVLLRSLQSGTIIPDMYIVTHVSVSNILGETNAKNLTVIVKYLVTSNYSSVITALYNCTVKQHLK